MNGERLEKYFREHPRTTGVIFTLIGATGCICFGYFAYRQVREHAPTLGYSLEVTVLAIAMLSVGVFTTIYGDSAYQILDSLREQQTIQWKYRVTILFFILISIGIIYGVYLGFNVLGYSEHQDD